MLARVAVRRFPALRPLGPRYFNSGSLWYSTAHNRGLNSRAESADSIAKSNQSAESYGSRSTTSSTASSTASSSGTGGSSSSDGGSGKRAPSKRTLIALASAGAFFAAYTTTDVVHDAVDFSFHAAKRTTSVLDAVTRCLWAYYWCLNGEYASQDDFNDALDRCHTHCAGIARRSIEYNKGLFIKIGQHISALTHVLPPQWTEAMIPLQDQCPVSSYDSINAMFMEDEGHSVEDLFAEFDHQPLGTASLAQVHRARLKDGTQVAVKVQHPELKTFIPLDVMLIGQIFAMIDFCFPQYPLSWLSDEVQNSIYTELDFREEAANAAQCGEYFANHYAATALRVPKVYNAQRRILTMEFLTGGRPDNLEFLKEHNIDRSELSYCFARIFNTMIFTPGVGLHCDPHAGNIAIRPLTKKEQRSRGAKHNFEIILYDHGLYRYVPSQTRYSYAHLWLAILAQDKTKIRKYAKEFAHVDDQGYEIFVATITGRDSEHAQGSVMTRRSDQESENMMRQIQNQGLVGPIMQMLKKMPNIVLLIIKTNDLVRYLDEKLDAPLGAIKSFLIMAHYCANSVYFEGLENIKTQYGYGMSWAKSMALARNWLSYAYTSTKISILQLVSPWIPADTALNI